MKQTVFAIFSLLILISCSTKGNEKSTIWVSGFKVTCDAGAGKSNCLLINKSDNLLDDDWEFFYTDIEGFEFQDGSLKKIEILVKEIEGQVAADQSKIKYTLVKELDQREDIRTLLSGEWELDSFEGQALNKNVMTPTLGFNVVEMKIYGNGGCNSYNGSIKQLGLKTIVLGDLINTLKICAEDTIETRYLSVLNQIRSYSIIESNLNLNDEKGNTILTFKKKPKTSNKLRIHDIWSAVRIESYPINRMVTVPRLEVNTKEMKIYGNDGCNNYFGTILDLNEETIAINGIGSTRKMCPDMEVPQRFNAALSKISSYRFDKQLLIFSDKDGNEVLAFLKTD